MRGARKAIAQVACPTCGAVVGAHCTRPSARKGGAPVKCPVHPERIFAFHALPAEQLRKSIDWLQTWWMLSQRRGGKVFSPGARPSLVRAIRRVHAAGLLELSRADGSPIPPAWLDERMPTSIWPRLMEGWVRPGRDWIRDTPKTTTKRSA